MTTTLVIRDQKEKTGISVCEKELLPRIKKEYPVTMIPILQFLPWRAERYLYFLKKMLYKQQKGTLKKQRKHGLIHLFDQQLATALNFMNPEQEVLVTIYDMYSYIPTYQKTLSFIQKKQYAFVNRGLKHISYAVTISDAVKKQIQKHLSLPPERIFVIRLGVDHTTFQKKKINQQTKDTLFHKYILPKNKRIILYVGAEKPQKNISSLIQAMIDVIRVDPTTIFVKIGHPQDTVMHSYHKDLVKKYELEEKVFFLDFIPDEDLVLFYNLAEFFVMPSLDEAGFDLPVVEAMACGCPIIYCDPSLMETIGSAGILTQPSPTTIGKTLLTLLNDQKRKKILTKEAIKQAKLFDWDTCAKQLCTIYRFIEEQNK